MYWSYYSPMRHGHMVVRQRYGVPSTVIMVVGMAAICGLVWLPSVPYYVFLAVTCGCLLYLARTNITEAICLFLLMNPFLFLARNSAPSAVLLAGSREIWVFTIAIVWSSSLLSGKARWPTGLDMKALVFFLVYAMMMTVFSDSLLDALLGIRSLAVPIVFYIILRETVSSDLGAGRRIMVAVAISAAILGVVSLLWYQGHVEALALDYGATIVGGGRSLLGYHFERMTSPIGGGAANASIFLGSGVIIWMAMATRKQEVLWRRILYLSLGALCAYATFLSLSRSFVILLLVSLAALLLSATTTKTATIAFVAIAAVVVLRVVIGTEFSDISLIDVMRQNSVMWSRALPDGMQLFFGSGIKAAGGGLYGGPTATIHVDAGWFGILDMMGLPGVFLMCVFCATLAHRLYRLFQSRILPPTPYTTGLIAGSAALGLLISSAHTAVIVRPASEIIFYALAAVTCSTYSVAFNRILAPRRSLRQP